MKHMASKEKKCHDKDYLNEYAFDAELEDCAKKCLGRDMHLGGNASGNIDPGKSGK